MNANNLAAEINRQLQLYAGVLEEEIDKAAEEVAKDGVEKLKSSSPNKTGKYAKSWGIKKVGKIFVLHNKRYQLTHLLENGHAKVNGGRVAPRVHIKPVEQQMIEDFEQKVKEAAQQ